MHGILSSAGLFQLEGIKVCWDFVELFSKYFEDWAYDEDFLAEFISDASIIRKVRSSRTFLKSYGLLFQLMRSEMDVWLHERHSSS